MQNVVESSREEVIDQIQQRANEIFSKHNGNLLRLSEAEHEQFKECANSYYRLTGEALVPKNTNADFQFI